MNTQLLLNRLVTGSMLRALNLALAAVIAFFMLPFLVENLGTRQYGLWVLVGTIMGYHTIMDFGLSVSVSRFFARALGVEDYKEINNIISTALVTFFIVGFVIFCAICVTASMTGVFLESAEEAELMSKVLFVVGIAVATQFPLRTFGGILTGTARHDLIVVTDLFRLITRTSLVVYFVYVGEGLLTLAIITMITEMCANYLEYRFAMSQAPYIKFSKKQVSWLKIKELYAFGWVAFIINISNTLRGRLLPLLVASLSGVEMVVFYTIATRLLEYFEQLIRTALGITMPILSRLEGQGKKEQLKEGYKIILTVSIMVTTFIGANFMFLGEPFIVMWMGEDFQLSYTILFLLTIPHVLFLGQIASEDLLYSISKHKFIAAVNFSGIIISVIASFVFHQYYPETGIAMGFIVGISITALTLPYIVCKQLGINDIWNIYYNVMFLSMAKILVPIAIYFYFVSGYVQSEMLSLLTWGCLEGIIMVPIFYLTLPKKVRNIVDSKLGGLSRRFILT